MTITFAGLNSVADRTLFTKRGPIVKKPLPVLSGSDLRIISPTEINIPSGSFTQTHIGFRIDISGSLGARNDGTFFIKQVLSPTKLLIENSSFSTIDTIKTVSGIISLANSLRTVFNAHILAPGVHNIIDTSHLVTAQIAVDLASANILLNQIANKASLHFATISGVHLVSDIDDVDLINESSQSINIASAILICNVIRKAFEAHRQNTLSHPIADEINRVLTSDIVPIIGTYPSNTTGPFAWTLYDPRIGKIADDPTDVVVRVNGVQVSVDAVFGLLGAIVLTTKPLHTDAVSIDYSYLNNPPTQIERLNSPEFSLNQAGNRNYAGLPSHKYRSRSSLIVPSSPATIRSAMRPRKVGWKYKALERRYTASLNDPNTLLLNVPTNKVSYQNTQTTIQEKVIKYDPISFPNNSTDPWDFEGDASDISLIPGGVELSINHTGSNFGTQKLPPFFSHSIDLSYPNLVSAAFRARVDTFTPDGAFTGVCFGISDGSNATVVGFLQTDAINISSGIVLANTIKASFNAHLIGPNVHITNDVSDSIGLVDASDVASLIILSNFLQIQYNKHINRGVADSVHLSVDISFLSVSPQATTLAGALAILNEIRANFNSHLLSSSHTHPDTLNNVGQVRQVGILTNIGYSQSQTSWNCVATDWTIYRTYRIFRDSQGNAFLYFSGISTPVASVPISSLPFLSSIDGKFDSLQQVFFGTIGKASSSISKWAFIRVDIQPLDSNQVAANKSVDYLASTTPETDPISPWIPVGQGGFDRINTNGLIVDSTATAPIQNIDGLGRSTGPYRGFLRLEPTLTSKASSSFEFTGKVGYYTFSVDNLASGVYIDDDQYAVHFVFIQANPTSAFVLGQSTEPFTLTSSDSIYVSINGGAPINILLTPGVGLTAAQVALNISSFGLPTTSVSGAIRIQSTTQGAGSTINLLGGSALTKLGLTPGTYFGSDSSPEPKVSWFGENRPDLDTPRWLPLGDQFGTMLGRTLRIQDISTTGFLVYGLEDPLVTSQAFSPSIDWKADFRLSVVSFSQGDILSGLRFCGALFNVDEGPSGKNIELQLATDNSGNPFVHIVSFDKVAGTIVSISQIPFAWNDFQPHTFNLFTSKLSNLVIILADGVVLGTVSLAALRSGSFGPSVSFGSGGPAATNTDLRAAQSVFDWSSVCIFRDSRISDPHAASNRYVGLYRGGDPTLLSSYYLSAIDWTSNHTYRIVRDPGSNVSVFIDNAAIPQISVNYDVLSLPPVSTSFLQQMTDGRPSVAFGSFNPREIDRTYWKPITYSIGKITQSNNIVPSYQEQNRANVVTSPDHLLSQDTHSHYGFRVYSSGTPTDDFLDSTLSTIAYTTLGEGTPPIPMSQDLDSLGGLVPNFIPLDSITADTLVNQRGFLSDYENDNDNSTIVSAILTYNQTVTALVNRTNDLITAYGNHLSRSSLSGPIHPNPDSLVPVTCTDLASAIISLNAFQSVYYSHASSAFYHVNSDIINLPTAPAASDLSSALVLIDDLIVKFGAHQKQGQIHTVQDTYNTISGSGAQLTLAYTISVLNLLKTAFNNHISQPGIHFLNDTLDFITAPAATDLPSAVTLTSALQVGLGIHIISTSGYHANPDTSDTIIGTTPTDINTLYQGVDELVFRYKLHIAKGSGTLGSPNIHRLADVINLIPGDGPLLGLLKQIDSFRSALNTHRTHSILNGVVQSFHKYERSTSLRPVTPLYNYSARIFNVPSIIASVNSLISEYNEHLASPAHEIIDVIYNFIGSPATDLDSSQTTITALRNDFNSHIGGLSWHQESPGSNYDPPPSINQIPPDPLNSAITAMNDLQTRYNAHVLRQRSHAYTDTSHLLLNHPATDLSSLITLSNAMKIVFNAHISSAKDHVSPDLVNTVTAPISTDLESVGELIAQEVTAFNAHRVQSGVHGTSVFVRLDPPSGTLYQGMKFYPISDGDPDQVSTISDDESQFIGTIGSPTEQSLEYPAGAMPERVVLVSTLAAPFTFVNGDSMGVAIDWADPINIIFQSTDTSVANVVARINGTPGIPTNFASDNGNGKVRMTSPTSTTSSNVQVTSGAAIAKLGFDHCQPARWKLQATDPTQLRTQLLSSGNDYLRIGPFFLGIGTISLYSAPTSLTNSNLYDVTLTISMRVNYTGSADSGIYVGFSGNPFPGFTIALGFDVDIITGVRFLKLVDLNNNNVLFRIPFQWGDGLFHVYRLQFIASLQAFQLIIVS